MADEPDGKEAAANATGLACERINQLDGYHPTSLALNCENYYFSEYTAGADIVMVDPYPIALNGGWSKRYGNAVDEDFGCSGCDNCKGTFYDIRHRVQSAKERLRLTGRGRTSPVWIVPQLFNGVYQDPVNHPDCADRDQITVMSFGGEYQQVQRGPSMSCLVSITVSWVPALGTLRAQPTISST